MTVRGWGRWAGPGAFALGAAALVAGCGGGTATKKPQPPVVHVDGARQIRDYIHETAADGVSFLVPTDVLAGQGSTSFEVATHAHEATGLPSNGQLRSWRMVTTATAVFSRSARVELLVTGSPGRRLNLSWEETCGGSRYGRHAVVGGVGGDGNLMLRSPAVVLVKLPRGSGAGPGPAGQGPFGKYRGENHTCYLATTGSAPATNQLRVQIIDY